MPTAQKAMKKLSRNEALQELFNLREKAATKKNRLKQLNAEDHIATDWSEASFAGTDGKPWLDEDFR